MIPQSDRKKLLELARNSIESVFKNQDVKVSNEIKKKYSKRQGVFVTLTKHGELRGCIGFPRPVLPLPGRSGR